MAPPSGEANPPNPAPQAMAMSTKLPLMVLPTLRSSEEPAPSIDTAKGVKAAATATFANTMDMQVESRNQNITCALKEFPAKFMNVIAIRLFNPESSQEADTIDAPSINIIVSFAY